jgi:uncharacterized protein DUF2510
MVDPAPPPGWYQDPVRSDHLRHWDGVRWTRETRRALAEADPPEQPAAARRSEDTPPRARKAQRQSAGILVALIIAFTAGGLYEVVVGSSGKTAVTGAFAAGPSASVAPSGDGAIAVTTTSTTTATEAPACAGQRDAGFLLRYLLLRDHFPVRVLTDTPNLDGGPASQSSAALCSTARFSDTRGTGTNVLAVYTNAGSAGQVAGGTSGSAIGIGPLVLTLDPTLQTLGPAYRSALTQAMTAVVRGLPG